jgi:Fe-S cluster assembly iron-binding protein IscA
VLTITDTAAEALEAIVASDPQTADTAGLRITRGVSQDGRQALAMAIADVPEPTDQVVESDRVPVFLEPETAALLDDKQLDARIEGDQIGFLLTEQTEPT